MSSDCLRVLRVAADEVPDFELDDDALATFVFPAEVDDFVETTFAKSCLAVIGKDKKAAKRMAGRVQSIQEALGGGDLRTLMQHSASEQIHVWFGSRSFTVEDVDAALACYENGASLYFRAPAELEHLLCHSLSAECGIPTLLQDPRAEIEVFASRKGHTTTWHWDFQHNFTYQLSGCKRWQLRQSRVPNALRGATPHFRDTGVVEEQAKLHVSLDADFALAEAASMAPQAEVELHAGACLHFPAGLWHQVECLEDSLSINVSIVPRSAASLVSRAVGHVAAASPTLRAPVTSVAALEQALEETRTLLSEVRATDLLPPVLQADTCLVARDVDSNTMHFKLDLACFSLSEATHLRVAALDEMRVNPLQVLLTQKDVSAEEPLMWPRDDDACDDEDSNDDTDETDYEVFVLHHCFRGSPAEALSSEARIVLRVPSENAAVMHAVAYLARRDKHVSRAELRRLAGADSNMAIDTVIGACLYLGLLGEK